VLDGVAMEMLHLVLILASFTKVADELAIAGIQETPVALDGIAKTANLLTPTPTSIDVPFTKAAPVAKCHSLAVCGDVTAKALQPSHVVTEVACLVLILASFTEVAVELAIAGIQETPVALDGIAKTANLLTPTPTSIDVQFTKIALAAK